MNAEVARRLAEDEMVTVASEVRVLRFIVQCFEYHLSTYATSWREDINLLWADQQVCYLHLFYCVRLLHRLLEALG